MRRVDYFIFRCGCILSAVKGSCRKNVFDVRAFSLFALMLAAVTVLSGLLLLSPNWLHASWNALLPTEVSIWQPKQYQRSGMSLSNISQHMFNAYYDTRNTLYGKRYVRIVAVLDTQLYTGGFRCLLFNKKRQRSFAVRASKSISGEGRLMKGHSYQQFLLSCEIGYNLSAASFVVVQSETSKHESSMIPVSHNPQSRGEPTQKLIVNCVSVTFGNPSEYRLIEWLEALRLLGMEKVVLHLHQVTNRKFEDVAAAYENEGLLDIRRLDCPVCGDSNDYLRDWHLMSTAINQCFYENLGRYKYTAVFDLDEIIMPQQHATYSEMLDYIGTRSNARSYAFFNWYHFYELGELPDVPRHLQMLRHPFCTRNHDPLHYGTKSIHRSQEVVVLHNHVSLQGVPGSSVFSAWFTSDHWHVPVNIGINQHFKSCHYDNASCAQQTKRATRSRVDRINQLLGKKLREAVEQKIRDLSLPLLT